MKDYFYCLFLAVFGRLRPILLVRKHQEARLMTDLEVFRALEVPEEEPILKAVYEIMIREEDACLKEGTSAMASRNDMEKYHMGAANQLAVTRQLIAWCHGKARDGARGKIEVKMEEEG